MIQTAKARQVSTERIADPGALELPKGGGLKRTKPAKMQASPERPSAMARLIQLDQGLYALDVGATAGKGGEISGPLPSVQVSAPPGRTSRVEIIGVSGPGESWLGPEGGTVIVKSPPGGGHVLVSAYGAPAQSALVPDIEVRRLDRPRGDAAGVRKADLADGPEEIRTEIALHIERLGDRRFPGQGWVGNRGKKLRIEAFGIRPLDTLTARDIEFKALGPNRRQTPWVTDAKLCGTRGQRLPLTGFAVRLAAEAGERFDAVYQGAFFESGIVGPNRNGELCISPIADDPLEAINVRLIRRPAR